MSMPSLRAAGKVVVVTGASRGLGRAMALGFAEAGADVVVASRKLDACRGGRCRGAGAGPTGLGGEAATSERRVRRAGSGDAPGIRPGRRLVNNAGIAPAPPSLLEVTGDLFDKTIAVKLKGPLRLTAVAAEYMPRGGTVINISSKASLQPSPFTVAYAAAKAGQNALTRRRRRSSGRAGIRVIGILCGTFHRTAFTGCCPRRSCRMKWPGGSVFCRIASADEIVGDRPVPRQRRVLLPERRTDPPRWRRHVSGWRPLRRLGQCRSRQWLAHAGTICCPDTESGLSGDGRRQQRIKAGSVT